MCGKCILSCACTWFWVCLGFIILINAHTYIHAYITCREMHCFILFIRISFLCVREFSEVLNFTLGSKLKKKFLECLEKLFWKVSQFLIVIVKWAEWVRVRGLKERRRETNKRIIIMGRNLGMGLVFVL